jgi:hypothetical protein
MSGFRDSNTTEGGLPATRPVPGFRLVQDHSPGAYAVTVSCYGCGERRSLADMFADLDGPAFQAYFCPECVPYDRTVPSCDHNGCARCYR